MDFAIGSVQGAVVASILFFGLVTLAEVIVWIKARHRPLIAGAVSVVTLGLYVAIWWWLWSGFYSISVRETTIELHRHFPSRVTTIDKTAITGVRWVAGYKNTWVLVVETAGGSHQSVRAGVPRDERTAISAALAR